MRLYPDCVRDVLIYLEDHLELYSDGRRVCRNEIGWKTIAEDDTLNQKYLIEDIQYAILQLSEAGFIEAHPIPGGQNRGLIGFNVLGITWTGHELLASLRGEELWKATKSIADQLGTYSVKALATIASAVVNQTIHCYFQGGLQP